MRFRELLHLSGIKDENSREMLREIGKFNLDINKNIIVFGKNSSGKTYLLDMILKSAGVLQQSDREISIQYIPLTRIFRSELLKSVRSPIEEIDLESSIDGNKNRSEESWINGGTIEKSIKYAREKYSDFLESVMYYIFNANILEEKRLLKEEIFKNDNNITSISQQQYDLIQHNTTKTSLYYELNHQYHNNNTTQIIKLSF